MYILLYMEETGISFGWNCNSAHHGVITRLRKRKENGYKTCPFDTMVTTYTGLIQCLDDDFKYFCDKDYLKVCNYPNPNKNNVFNGENIIVNTKYNFLFNHESPGHGKLYITEKWSKGINHFIENEFEEFIIRYQRRIQNFRNYLLSGNKIHFILTRYNTKIEDIHLLDSIIKKKYPLLVYDFTILEEDKDFMYNHLSLLLDEEDDEIKRLK